MFKSPLYILLFIYFLFYLFLQNTFSLITSNINSTNLLALIDNRTTRRRNKIYLKYQKDNINKCRRLLVLIIYYFYIQFYFINLFDYNKIIYIYIFKIRNN